MMRKGARRSQLPWLAAVAVLLLSLLLAALVPIYTDEIGWRLQLRAAIDGVDIMFNDICGPNTLAHPAWFMIPVRWFSASMNLTFADPFFVRAAGVACAILWIGLLFVLTWQVERDADRRVRTQTVLLALLGMGLLPFLMVLSRPEQPILLAMTAIIILTLLPVSSRYASVWAWAKVVLILLLAAFALSYHIKGVLYSVVAFACLAVCARGRGTMLARVTGCAALLALTLSAALYWIERFQCPGDPELAAMLARENVAAVIAEGGGVTELVLQAVRGANPLNYVALAIPTAWPMSNWLPPEMFSGTVTSVVGIFLYMGWLAAFALAVLALARYFSGRGWRGLTEPRVPIIFAIFSCVLVWGASQLNKNAYEAAHVLPMALVAFALAWSLPKTDRFMTSRIEAALPLAFVTAAGLSQLLVLSASAAPLFRSAQTPGYPERQPFSVSIAAYDTVRRDIEQAMDQAGIPSDRPLHRLLIDDLTYLALQRHRLPLHRLGVLSTWNGSIDDPVEYLRSRDSDGVVVGCAYLPPDMRAAASRSGEICAISRAGLDRLAAARG
ncbi:MAG TPA: hypothetical protein VNR60_05005 [Croceibacterium sp.]|nr:hypothetical protein [Croceibacterium sp.]